MTVEGPQVPPPPPGSCGVYVEKKRRYCRLQTKPGARYCSAHLPRPESADESERKKCPYEIDTWISASAFERHLKVCPSRPKPVPPFVTSGLNLAPGELHFEPRAAIAERKANTEALDAMPVEQFLIFADKVNGLYEKLVGDLPDLSGSYDLSSLLVGNLHMGKHPHQIASLLFSLQSRGLLDPRFTYAEFGAGKAELGRYVAGALEEPATFVLIDRENSRNKNDAAIRRTLESKGMSHTVHRLEVDIADLDLGKCNLGDKPVVGFSKHLCGPATDLTLRCLDNFAAKGGQTQAVMVALCCHQRCTLPSLCGGEFLVGEGPDRLTKNEFRALCVISTWTLAWFRATKSGADDEDETADSDVKPTSFPPDGHWSGLPQERLEQLGFRAKRLMDYARKRWLEERGWKVELGYFIERNVTPENVVLIATRGQ